jgi:uncharacterized protein (DUF488 family)
MRSFYTIGHSSHPADHFFKLLSANGIEVLVDTRSYPYSKRVPHFDRETLRDSVGQAGARYLYLGDVIGGRPKDKAFYDASGRALYGKVAESLEFLSGIDRLERGADQYRVALLCSEEDPAHCHRRLLIGRVLIDRGAELIHIRGDNRLEDDAAVASRSGKLLLETQPALLSEIDEAQWRSTASVSPKNPQRSSSAR